jgi:hypothetical protein
VQRSYGLSVSRYAVFNTDIGSNMSVFNIQCRYKISLLRSYCSLTDRLNTSKTQFQTKAYCVHNDRFFLRRMKYYALNEESLGFFLNW